MNKKKALFFDIDGTLAIHTDRAWNEYDKCETDKLCDVFGTLFHALMETDIYILVVTGRPSRYRQETNDWLIAKNLMFDALYMRDDGDQRSNREYKRAVLIEKIFPIFDVVSAFEDHPAVVQMLVDEFCIPTFQPHRVDEKYPHYNPQELDHVK